MPYKDKGDQRKHYMNNKDSYKWRSVKNQYDLSKEDFFDILEKQDNKCALCKEVFQSLKQNHLHIDHDHEKNKVRGFLCMKCNVGLGMLGDNEEGLIKALS